MAVAIITGASRGFGRALATSLAERGWDLVLDARNAGPLEDVAERLRTYGGAVSAVAGDVADAAHRVELVASAWEMGGLDLLVNNAGVLGAEPLVTLDELPVDAFRRALEINVVAPLALLQEALPLLRDAPAGTVLNMSSDAASEAYRTWGGYGATKAALDQVSAVLGVEEPGLRVWAVDPGGMRTDMLAAAEPDEDLSGVPRPEDVVPAFLRLLDERPASGRYAAPSLLEVR
ncbi:SDR family NAD(P)-dependent oxidoreductase [Streptomyces sp. SID8379]|uniref:SDR family NAD(P)-dependent oxidoreductase n=1 Tax=unclassified Streptomyces TaxID=2593676 RepID=UPI00036AD307|nr:MULTISPECIES: SDR family oxidoreductase [unclassified Streptomyces]MYW66654.1 SDR family NAD(P)-dependent oxidoreductase [Streptomyces sp. SID8379]